MNPTHFDVVVVGAGLSGIGAACHLEMRCPGKTYTVLEGRPSSGGTWDLFRYPGIRSDSDMYTLGYSFRPWTNPKAIADGASILKYVRDTAEAYGVDRKIRYRHRVEGARWSSRQARWTVTARDLASGQAVELTCRFLYVCAGYYDYEEGYTPEFAGTERFRGRIVHPQHWPEDIALEGKRVVVIGSGATAVTLVPELSKQAAHVTMLQRSPTYMLSAPEGDPVANWLRDKLPPRAAYGITRVKNVALSMGFFSYCRRFPEHARSLLVKQARRQLRDKVPVEPHFSPSYKPWDQRLCLVRDGDLFRALRQGKASVVTDHIETFTEKGLRLKSGAELEADVIVTATGLKLKFLGGLSLEVDGKRVGSSETMIYRGMMCSDVPNMAFAIGYTNASWTLKCDLVAEYVCRLLKYMDRKGYTSCRPHNADPAVKPVPLMDFSAGYVLRSIDQFPRQGTRLPWKLWQNYALDRVTLKRARIDDGVLQFAAQGGQASYPAGA